MSFNAEVVLGPGDILYREGDPNDCAYIIESGEIIIYRELDGEKIYCERRRAGSIVGELSILADRPRAVTVEAVTDCRIFQIPAEQILQRYESLDPVLRASIDTSINFSATFCERMYKRDGFVPVAPATLPNSSAVIEQFRFEQDILTGVERGEFSLVYQPIVRLSDSSVVGIEALMRWQHPVLGNVPPFRFIEVAEAMGSINKLTELALSQACAALQRIRSHSSSTRDLYVSVNISGKDLGVEGFVDFVAHILDANGLEGKGLTLEVTETALVADPEGAARQLGKLRNLGCGVSIDDFGTGYSNLAYLKSLPFSTLKIDRAFAGDAHANEVSRSIVRMLLGFGKDLGKDIVAEGLETAEDVTLLRDLGCSYAQGYHFGKPASEADLLEHMDRFVPDSAGVAA